MATARMVTHDRALLRAIIPIAAIVMGCLPLCSMPASAQTKLSSASGLSPEMQAKLAKRGDLVLREATLVEALFTIRESWNINLVVGSEVQGHVNGAFSDAPLHEILDSILLARGFGYRPLGNSLVIVRLEDLGDVKPLFKTEIIPLKHASPTEIVTAIKILLSPNGKAYAVPSSQSIMATDFPDRIAIVRARIGDLDDAAGRLLAQLPGQIPGNGGTPGSAIKVAYYSPQYVKAEQLVDALKVMLSANGKIAIVKSENRIVVSDRPGHLNMLERAVASLDVPRRQVRIRALIYDVSVTDMETMGVNWSNTLRDGSSNQLFTIDTITRVATAPGAVNGALNFVNTSRYFDLDTVVNMLSTAKDSRLLADPNVTVLDQEAALMSIVREIPYQQLTETSEGGNIGTTAFKEAGIKLEVTPHIARDGTISMVVTPSFSVLTGFTEEENQPIIDRREATTTVRIENNRTLIIGGLRQRTEVAEFSGIPGLMELPHLGKLFRSKNIDIRESELLVFITPQIVSTDHMGGHREITGFASGNGWLDQVPQPEQCLEWGGTPGLEYPTEEVEFEHLKIRPEPADLPSPQDAAQRPLAAVE